MKDYNGVGLSGSMDTDALYWRMTSQMLEQ